MPAHLGVSSAPSSTRNSSQTTHLWLLPELCQPHLEQALAKAIDTFFHLFIHAFIHSCIHSLIHALTPANKSVLLGTGAQSPEPNLPVRDPVIAEGTTHQHTPWQPALQSAPAPCPPPHYLYASSPLPVRKG